MFSKRLPLALLALILIAGTAAITMVSPARACAEVINRIAYVQSDGCVSSVWIMTADGANKIEVSTGYSEVSHLSWAPDHSGFVFAADSGSGPQIFHFATQSVDVTQRHVTQLTDDPAWKGTPSFSPDGTKILFSSDRSGHRQLWTMGLDGSSPQQLTFFDDSIEPVWASYSPDGTRIVFATPDDGNTNIYVANADGTGLRRLTISAFEDAEPSWSPDGTHIVWASSTGGPSSIWIMAADGSDKRQLTSAACQIDRSPRFSPDGTLVVFSRLGGSHPAIFTVKVADPTQVEQLTFLSAAGATDPAWDVVDTSASTTTTTTPTTVAVDTPLVPAYAC